MSLGSVYDFLYGNVSRQLPPWCDLILSSIFLLASILEPMLEGEGPITNSRIQGTRSICMVSPWPLTRATAWYCAVRTNCVWRSIFLHPKLNHVLTQYGIGRCAPRGFCQIWRSEAWVVNPIMTLIVVPPNLISIRSELEIHIGDIENLPLEFSIFDFAVFGVRTW